ncbi:MAG: restriction endonuclease [Planctomycetes bacterium]|nr:restriction endonuclease [Planctomycetota bacterium]
MAVPGYQEFMLPLLKIAADGQEHRISDAMETLASDMDISHEDQDIMLPSGTQTRYYNRGSWAITYLTKSLLLEKPARGRFRLAPRGAEVLRNAPSRIDDAFLEQFPEYQAFKTKKRAAKLIAPSADADERVAVASDITPEEQLEAAYEELRDALADDLRRRVRDASPRFFEHLVIRLLVAMGYGGGQVDRGEVTGRSGDEGIDGVIREDRLGLDMVYVQAKKWDSAVGPSEIDKFVGSLMRKKATKGVFITSGAFTEGAQRAAKEAAVKVRIIDGDELAELMIDFNVGVAPADTYIVKKVDTDFFEGVA